MLATKRATAKEIGQATWDYNHALRAEQNLQVALSNLADVPGAETTETYRNIDLCRLQVRALQIKKAQLLRDLGVDVEEPEE